MESQRSTAESLAVMEGMGRIGEIAIIASEQALNACRAAQEALARATVAEAHAEGSAAAAAATAMRVEELARRSRRREARPRREAGSRRPARETDAPGPGDPLSRFSDRADRLVARLHRIELHPAANATAPNGGAGA
jgi:hypothetical protein